MPTTLARFALVGVINTAIGFTLILLGLRLGLGDYAANALGYGIGLGVSYAFNRSWVFKAASAPSMQEFGRFAVAFAIAYAANLGILGLGRAAGLAGQPLLHLAGLGLYSILFYVLSRVMVFRKAGQVASPWRERIAAHGPEAVLLVAAAAAALALRGIPLSHDVVWQLWIARQLVHGATLYRDILELNPPLWFWSAVPLEWIGRSFDIPPGRLLVQAVIAGATLSAMAFGALAQPDRPLRRGLLMLLLLVCVIVVPIYDFGQREQLTLIGALPYAALVARRRTGRDVPWQLALAVGVAAAYGFALKHYFAVIPLGLEAWLLIGCGRGKWQPLRPETIALATFAMIYASAVVFFTPDFLGTMLPMIRAAYHGYESAWPAVLVRPWTAIWACLAIYILLGRSAAREPDKPLVSALLITAAGFAMAYLLQRKGWLYHSVPVTGAMTLAAGALALSLAGRSRSLAVMGAVMIALPLSLPLRTGTYHNPFRKDIDPVLATLAPGETLFIAAADPMWGWPTAEDHGLLLRSRLYAYWMLPAIAHAEIVGPYPAELQRLALQIRRVALDELRCGRPAMIIFERRRNYSYQPAAFDVQQFFGRSAQLRNFIDTYYTRIPSPGSVAVYRRRSGIPIANGLVCPPFS